MGWMDVCVFSSRVGKLKSVTVDFCGDISSSLSDAHCSTSTTCGARVAVAPQVVSGVAETVKSSA